MKSLFKFNKIICAFCVVLVLSSCNIGTSGENASSIKSTNENSVKNSVNATGGQFVYVATRSNGTIIIYSNNNGELSPTGKSVRIKSPTDIAINNTKGVIYTITYGLNSSTKNPPVSQIQADGTVKSFTTTGVGNNRGIGVSPDGRFLFVLAYYNQREAILTYQLNEGGLYTSSTPNKVDYEPVNATYKSMVFTPDGKYV